MRVVIFEDALAGIEAGNRGQFGRVFDIDRGQQSMALRQHSADVAIESLKEVHVEETVTSAICRRVGRDLIVPSNGLRSR